MSKLIDEARFILRESNIDRPGQCNMNDLCRCQICVEWALEIVSEHEKEWSGYGGTWNHPGYYD